MTILHAPQFTEHLSSVLAEAQGQPHNVDISLGFSLSGFNRIAEALATRWAGGDMRWSKGGVG